MAPSSSRIGDSPALMSSSILIVAVFWQPFGRCNEQTPYVHHSQSERADGVVSISVATGDGIRQRQSPRSLKRLLRDILLLWQHKDEALFGFYKFSNNVHGIKYHQMAPGFYKRALCKRGKREYLLRATHLKSVCVEDRRAAVSWTVKSAWRLTAWRANGGQV